jgi:hypothetical protein
MKSLVLLIFLIGSFFCCYSQNSAEIQNRKTKPVMKKEEPVKLQHIDHATENQKSDIEETVEQNTQIPEKSFEKKFIPILKKEEE